jgi:uncharacterized cupin superfamily protein
VKPYGAQTSSAPSRMRTPNAELMLGNVAIAASVLGLGAEQTGMNFLIVKPGRWEAFAHRHRTAEEIYVVLAGTGRVKLDDQIVELAPLQCHREAWPVDRRPAR